MERSTGDAASGRGSEPRVITQGVLDGDAVVYELFPMQTLVFDAELPTQRIPFPLFDSTEYRTGVLSVMLKKGVTLPSTFVRLRILNAVQTPDDPAVTFSQSSALISLDDSDPDGSLHTVSWPVVGPSGRLSIETNQNTSGAFAIVLAAWLTLRSA